MTVNTLPEYLIRKGESSSSPTEEKSYLLRDMYSGLKRLQINYRQKPKKYARDPQVKKSKFELEFFKIGIDEN